MIITGVTPQKKNGRYNVFIDGKFSFGIDELILIREGVRVGLEVDDLWLKKIKESGFEGVLYDKTLGFLAIRPRSAREVKDYLFERLVVKEKMEKAEALTLSSAILERLKIAGFIDDLKFAQWFVAQRREGNKPKGDRAIRFELAGKGVSADLISEALKRDPEEAELDEKTLASVALERKKRSLMGLSKKELDAKITSFLSRRGFSWDTIKSVIREW